MRSGARQPAPPRSRPCLFPPLVYLEHVGKARGARGHRRFCHLSPSGGLSLHPRGFPKPLHGEVCAGMQQVPAQSSPCLSFPIHREGRTLGCISPSEQAGAIIAVGRS